MTEQERAEKDARIFAELDQLAEANARIQPLIETLDLNQPGVTADENAKVLARSRQAPSAVIE
jgi:hypothetical protein